MKKRYFLSFLLAAGFGTVSHFFYRWLPLPIVGLFFPMNESVWEHLKLLFFPTLLAGIGLGTTSKAPHRTWSALLCAALAMPVGMLGVYYLLAAGFGLHSLWIDISLYFFTMAAGFYGAYRLDAAGTAEKRIGLLVMLAGVYGASLILFSFAAPDLPIFRS